MNSCWLASARVPSETTTPRATRSAGCEPSLESHADRSQPRLLSLLSSRARPRSSDPDRPRLSPNPSSLLCPLFSPVCPHPLGPRLSCPPPHPTQARTSARSPAPASSSPASSSSSPSSPASACTSPLAVGLASHRKLRISPAASLLTLACVRGLEPKRAARAAVRVPVAQVGGYAVVEVGAPPRYTPPSSEWALALRPDFFLKAGRELTDAVGALQRRCCRASCRMPSWPTESSQPTALRTPLSPPHPPPPLVPSLDHSTKSRSHPAQPPTAS